ncbi:MAG: alpha/beta hydrolase [Clostridia bacterium]|nr:alpha/beta hydrolase [Clostridia bacterium]
MLYLYIGLGVIAFFLLGFFLSILIVTPLCYKRLFHRKELSPNALSDAHYAPFRKEILDAKARMEALPYKELTCVSYDGTELYAKYYDFGRDKTVIFMHGVFTHPLINFSVHAERFIEWGFNVLLPDERAHGKSGGNETTYGYRERYDLLAWIDLERKRTNHKIVVYGTSMGAMAVALASDQMPEGVCAAVYDCGFCSMSDNMRYFSKRYHAPYLMFWLMNGMCRRRLAIDLDESAEEHLKRSKIPAVFVHGTEDVATLAKNSEINYRACAAPKELIMVEGCGHTTAAMSDETSQKVYQFIKKYI